VRLGECGISFERLEEVFVSGRRWGLMMFDVCTGLICLAGCIGHDKPPKIMFTDRKYEPMGNVIMAKVKARSL
jgi:hypothetical protein